MSDEFNLEAAIPQVMRVLATSSADNAQRDHEFAIEKAEMTAWDAFADVWLKSNSALRSEGRPDPVQAAADFADAMINRRRKYFGMEIPEVPSKPPG